MEYLDCMEYLFDTTEMDKKIIQKILKCRRCRFGKKKYNLHCKKFCKYDIQSN